MGTTVVNLALVLLTLGSAWWVVLVGVPSMATARFTADAQRRRDAIMDKVLDGELPLRDPAVRRLLLLLTLMADRPERFGLTEAFALREALRRVPIRMPAKPGYELLTAEQRKFMYTMDHEIMDSQVKFLTYGSRFWLLFLLLVPVHWVAAKRQGLRAARTPQKPQQDEAASANTAAPTPERPATATVRGHDVPWPWEFADEARTAALDPLGPRGGIAVPL